MLSSSARLPPPVPISEPPPLPPAKLPTEFENSSNNNNNNNNNSNNINSNGVISNENQIKKALLDNMKCVENWKIEQEILMKVIRKFIIYLYKKY